MKPNQVEIAIRDFCVQIKFACATVQRFVVERLVSKLVAAQLPAFS